MEPTAEPPRRDTRLDVLVTADQARRLRELAAVNYRSTRAEAALAVGRHLDAEADRLAGPDTLVRA